MGCCHVCCKCTSAGWLASPTAAPRGRLQPVDPAPLCHAVPRAPPPLQTIYIWSDPATVVQAGETGPLSGLTLECSDQAVTSVLVGGTSGLGWGVPVLPALA